MLRAPKVRAPSGVRKFHTTAPRQDNSRRVRAIENLTRQLPVETDVYKPGQTPLDIWATDVFGDSQMRERLPGSTYDSFKQSVEDGTPLDGNVADQIAAAMKEWAVAKGATHYTHWFQPLTMTTAEKHDSFLSFANKDLYNRQAELRFSGKELIKGEPDASSFPSGGLRNTAEARGYTAWDMTSPSFIRRGPSGNFLVVPTAFVSWTGELLDVKAPLLRSNEAVSRAATRLFHLLGDKNVKSASAELGVEQEFFLVDRGFYSARPDLVACGRTLLGARPPKGQQLEDHYFGTVDRRILSFIQDCEWTLWRLGVPNKTRHNEVAPAQYEMAPIFGVNTLASDQNLLTLEVLQEVAKKHGFAALLHEKPFAGVNGSGKHNNWTVSSNTGINLMDPGHTPEQNARFLLTLTALCRMVHLNGDLLRNGIVTPGNDHRLGANEAPPAIISLYIGSELDKVVQQIVSTSGSVEFKRQKGLMQLGVSSLPHIPLDASDRNRTSPFAFTGNKFEFRAVGSSQTTARPAMILNTIFADALNWVNNNLEKELKSGKDLSTAVATVVREGLKAHHHAIFNGNGYTEEWVQEAAKRNLPNLRTTPEALKAFTQDKNVKIFESMGVLNKKEIHATQEILYEQHIKVLNIEANTLLNMAQTGVLPAALGYQRNVSSAVTGVNNAAQAKFLSSVTGNAGKLIESIEALKRSLQDVEKIDAHNLHEKSTFYHNNILNGTMKQVRDASDELESVVDDQLWPFPKYSEILFFR